jgi:hypothetical protein
MNKFLNKMKFKRVIIAILLALVFTNLSRRIVRIDDIDTKPEIMYEESFTGERIGDSNYFFNKNKHMLLNRKCKDYELAFCTDKRGFPLRMYDISMESFWLDNISLGNIILNILFYLVIFTFLFNLKLVVRIIISSSYFNKRIFTLLIFSFLITLISLFFTRVHLVEYREEMKFDGRGDPYIGFEERDLGNEYHLKWGRYIVNSCEVICDNYKGFPFEFKKLSEHQEIYLGNFVLNWLLYGLIIFVITHYLTKLRVWVLNRSESKESLN